MTVQYHFKIEQNTPEWMELRAGMPTASRFSDVLAKGQGKTRRKYLYQLAGEILTGAPDPGWEGNRHTERGHALEDEARDTYAFLRDHDPIRCGFVTNGQVGYSPDSLIGDSGLLEVKTKLPHLQIECLMSDKLPPEHKPQCQGGLWVSEREWLDFVSFWPGLPLFVKRVYRDDEYISTLASEVKAFCAELHEIVGKLQEYPEAA